jgi:hypothetical protein
VQRQTGHAMWHICGTMLTTTARRGALLHIRSLLTSFRASIFVLALISASVSSTIIATGSDNAASPMFCWPQQRGCGARISFVSLVLVTK